MSENRPERLSSRPIRIVIGLAVAVAGAGVAFVLLFIGVVETTGCLFECTEPNYLTGVPALVGAAACGASAVGGLVWAFTDRTFRSMGNLVAMLTGVGCLLLVVAVVLG